MVYASLRSMLFRRVRTTLNIQGSPYAIAAALVRTVREVAKQVRSARLLGIALSAIWAVQGPGAMAQSGAPVPVQPLPVPPELLYSNPAVINPSNPPAPSLGAASPLVTPAGLPAAVGRTGSTFAVSQTGAATYAIPIWVPPGVRGIYPKLALVYSSNQGNGLLGVGWSISGLSLIGRCNRTYAQDGGAGAPQLDASDVFCLDGNRLRLVTGTYGADGATYQTEIANFSNVTSHSTAGSGPAYFTVQGKDGLTYEYGHTTDSAILAYGATSVAVWALDKVSDRTGNSMTFTYTNDTTNGSYRPKSIQYTYTTNSPTVNSYEVTFTYQARAAADGLWKYRIGGINDEFNLIGAITANTVSGSTLTAVKTYNLTYSNGPATSRSLLTQVQECSASDCLSPTIIAYQPGATGWASATASGGDISSVACAIPLDLNGDGLEDLVYPDSTTGHWFYLLGTTSGGYESPVDTGFPGTCGAAVPIDYFSTGNMDLLVANSAGNWRVLSFQSAGSAFTYADTTIAAPSTIAGFVMVGDVNGDGRDDLIYAVSGGSSYTTPDTIYYLPNTGSGFGAAQQLYQFPNNTEYGPYIKFNGAPFIKGGNIYSSRVRRADFNGDGRIDFLANMVTCVPDKNLCNAQAAYSYSWNLFLSKSDGTYGMIDVLSNGFLDLPSGPPPLLGDFDGDGCTDIAYIVSNVWTLQYGTCWRAGATSALSSAVNTGITAYGIYPLALDWDGDGRDDIVEPNSTTGDWGVMRSTGSSSSPLSAWASTGIAYANQGALVSDVNGDGQFDIVSASATTHAPYTLVHNSAGAPADLAISFTDGYGMNESPSYLSLALDSNYAKYTDGVYPDVDWKGPMYVVSSFSASDGAGGTYAQSFGYYGARLNLQGRGFDGFYAQRIYDNRNQLYDYQYYSRTFPTTGMMLEDVLEPSSSPYLHAIVYTPATTTLDSTTNNQRYFPYIATSSEADNESGGPDNGDEITNIVKSYVYDTYGNATTVATTTTDEDVNSPWYKQAWETETISTITPNTANWCLNLPTQVKVQKTIGGGTSLTRTTSLTPDYVNCRITTKVDEPSSTTLKVTTTYGFDTCGNIDSISVVGVTPTGSAMPARTTSANFGTPCQIPQSITNSMNETTNFANRYDFVVPSSTTDPNGLTTSWLYDNYGRKTRETKPNGTYSTFTLVACNAGNNYCSGGDLRSGVQRFDFTTTGTAIRSATLFWDGFDRQRYDEEENIAGGVTYASITYYDQLGRTQYQYMPFLSGGSEAYHEYTYDLLSRVTYDQFYEFGTLNRQILYSYAGRQLAVTDPMLNVTNKYVNVLGQLGEVVDPSPGGTTNYTYEPFGNLTSVKDPASNVTTWLYNLRGFKTSSTDPDRGSWTYSPDSLGEVVSQTDAKAQTITFIYDKLSRMTSRTEAEGTSTWIWGTSATAHNIDQLASMSGPGYSESYAYDSFARLQGTNYTADTGYTINRGYNAQTGFLDDITYPASTGTSPLRIQFGYSYGILTQISDFNTPATVYWKMTAQDAWMNPTDEQLFNGVQVLSTHDPLTGHLNSRTSGTTSPYTNQQNMTFSFNKDEGLTDRIDVNQGNLDEHFNYDALNRITGSTLAGVSNLSAGFDATGNISSKSDVGTYTYNTTHKHAVASITNGDSFSYDANGNMTNGRGATFGWMSYNYPSSITVSSSESSAFAYTPDRRLWKQTAQYSNGSETTMYIGGLFEKVSNATVTDYHHLIHAGTTTIVLVRSTGTNNQTYYVTRDHLGSGAVVTNSSGALILNERFAAYGSRRGSNWTGTPSPADWSNIASSTRHGFTDHVMLDNLNLIHMKGRVYDNVIGRFVSPDPTTGGSLDSQSINPYGYVRNDALSAIDPTGFDTDPTFDIDGGNSNDPPADWPATQCSSGGCWAWNQGCSNGSCNAGYNWVPNDGEDSPPNNPASPPSNTLNLGNGSAFGGGAPGGAATKGGVSNLSSVTHAQPQGNQPGKTNPVIQFLCQNDTPNPLQQALNTAGNAGTAADGGSAAMQAAVVAAAASRSLDSPQAWGFLSNQAAGVLSVAGRVGSVASGYAIAVDAVNGQWSTALYDTIDMGAYWGLGALAATGITTAGTSTAAAFSAGGVYYVAGGSKGLVQSALCN